MLTQIKSFWKSKWLIIFLVCLIPIGFGLADYDYYWQVECGKNILKHFDFYSFNRLSWYTEDLGFYLDHEWLSNIVFYIFSLIGDKGVFLLHLFICSLLGISIVQYIKYFNNNINGIELTLLCLMIFFTGSILFKIKAYNYSIIFLMYELYLLDRYKINHEIRPLIPRFIILTLLWNNVHSSSVLLLYGIAGVYWLLELRDKKSLGLGVLSLPILLINPYGYKLIWFDVFHSFDPNMKSIVKDWQSIDAKTSQGMLGALAIICVIVAIKLSYRKNVSMFVLTLVMIIFSLQSERHLIYLLPFACYWITSIDIDKIQFKLPKIEDVEVYCNIFMVGLILLISFSTLTDKSYTEKYCMKYMPVELINIVQEQEYDGLYTSTDELLAWSGKPFYTGCYPLNSNRTITTEFLNTYANSTFIANIIENYGLSKFLITKYNAELGENFVYESVLYDYLTQHSDKYECLYESETYCYFIEVEP